MGITVTSGATGADVSRVKPRLSVSVVDPVLSVARAVPVTALSYVYLSIAAGLDTSGRFKYLTDVAVMADGTAFSLAKPVSDAFEVQDNVVRATEKGLDEAIALADVVETVLIFLRDFADTAGMSDTQALDVAKAIVDAVAATDAMALAFSAGITDTVSLVETASLSVAKEFVDSLAADDAYTLNVDKALADALSLSEATVFSVSKALDDASLVEDNSAYDATKALADGVGLNELLSFEYSLAASIDNVTFTGDTAVLSVDKAAADFVAFAESGLVVVQDYCDLTYFVEDYVGTVTYF